MSRLAVYCPAAGYILWWKRQVRNNTRVDMPNIHMLETCVREEERSEHIAHSHPKHWYIILCTYIHIHIHNIYIYIWYALYRAWSGEKMSRPKQRRSNSLNKIASRHFPSFKSTPPLCQHYGRRYSPPLLPPCPPLCPRSDSATAPWSLGNRSETLACWPG